ncbi:hypothetical protein C8R45DRAFT_1029709, partial [Mycena sanguinolenta]
MVRLYLFWEFFNRLLQDQISDLEYANTFSKPLHRSLAQFTTSCRGAWHRGGVAFTCSQSHRICVGCARRNDTVHRSYGPQHALNCPGFCALRRRGPPCLLPQASLLDGVVAALRVGPQSATAVRCCPLNPGSLCFACIALAAATVPLHLAARVPVQRCNGPVVRQRGYVAGIPTWSHLYQISAFGIAGARVSPRRGRQPQSQWRAAPYRHIGRGTGAQPIRASGNATDGMQCCVQRPGGPSLRPASPAASKISGTWCGRAVEKVYLYRNITSIHFVTF